MAIVTLPNGINYSWENASVIIFGIPIIGITKIDIKSKQNKENNYGVGSEPTSRGYGNKEYECSFTFYFDELARIIAAAPNRDIRDIPAFDFVMVLGGTRVTPFQVKIKMAEFLESNFATNQGDTKVLIEVPMIIGGIEY
jgi:hypothetical protein